MKKINFKNKKIIIAGAIGIILISTIVLIVNYNRIFNSKNNQHQQQEIDFRNSEEKEYIENEYKNIDTSNWNTYKDPEFGFEFKYPANLKVENTGYEYEGIYYKEAQSRDYSIYISDYSSYDNIPLDAEPFMVEIQLAYPYIQKEEDTFVLHQKIDNTIIGNKAFFQIYTFYPDNQKSDFCFENIQAYSFKYVYLKSDWRFLMIFSPTSNSMLIKKQRMTLFRAIADTLKLPDSIPEPEAIIVK